MASTQCPCVPPFPFAFECPHPSKIASLNEAYSKLDMTSDTNTRARHCHDVPDQYTLSSSTDLPPSPTRAAPSIPSVVSNKAMDEDELEVKRVAELGEIQAKEEYMIEKYHSVFEMLENSYRKLEAELKWEAENSFQEEVIRAVMAGVRECIGMNEIALSEGRGRLWGFEGRQDEEYGQEEGRGEDTTDDEVKGKITWW